MIKYFTVLLFYHFPTKNFFVAEDVQEVQGDRGQQGRHRRQHVRDDRQTHQEARLGPRQI